MPIVVPMSDAMLGIIDALRGGQFFDTYHNYAASMNDLGCRRAEWACP